MPNVRAEDLSPWRDSDEILRHLGNIAKEEVTDLAPALVALLDHEDPDVREEAAQALFVVGKHREHRARAVELLKHDSDVAVRCTAAYGVAATSSDDSRRSDIGLLATIVRDDTQDTELRRSAYEALLIIFRRPRFPSMTGPFNPVVDVDWDWLDQLRSQE